MVQASGDGGFLVGSESGFNGSAFVFDDSADRFGVQIDTQLAHDATTSTPEAYTVYMFQRQYRFSNICKRI